MKLRDTCSQRKASVGFTQNGVDLRDNNRLHWPRAGGPKTDRLEGEIGTFRIVRSISVKVSPFAPQK